MPRRLVLVRHAKAEQTSPDLERALSPRGRSDAAAIGRWLASRGITPYRVVVSPSLRTRQTWELAGSTTPEIDRRIYGNTIDDLLEIIRETPDDVQTLVLVGHNPSVGGLAATLDPDVQEFPTSATVVFDVDDWLRPHGARLVEVAVPRG